MTNLLGDSDIVLLQYVELCSERLKLLLQLRDLALQLLQEAKGVAQVVQGLRGLAQPVQTDGQTDRQ